MRPPLVTPERSAPASLVTIDSIFLPIGQDEVLDGLRNAITSRTHPRFLYRKYVNTANGVTMRIGKRGKRDGPPPLGK